MVKRIFKRIFVFSSVACLVLASVPSISFAVDPVSGAAALAGAMDAYGMAYGVGTVYDVSSSSGVSSSFEGLWDDFSSYQSNNGSEFDYDSYIENYNQNRSLYGFEHSSGKFAAWHIDAESAEIFDQFWNWLLTGPAEMTRVDNEFFEFSSSQIGDSAVPLPISSVSLSALNGYEVVPLPISIAGNSYFHGNINGTFTNDVTSSSPAYAFYCLTTDYLELVVVSSSASTLTNVFTRSNGYTQTTSPSMSAQSGLFVSRIRTYANDHSYNGEYPQTITLPVYNGSYTDLSSIFGDLTTPDLSTTEDSVGVKAYGNGYVTVPDPSLPDYEPTPLEIVTSIPWDTTYDDTDEEDGEPVPFPPVDVPLVVDDIITAISAEDYALEEDPQDPDPDPPPPAPSEVFVPLLPVGLPSFNFSFSGIWHYVREWVSSLGAWFTTLFTIWGSLPYAMVVPVYATAVVVIVLGVYKRFFM